jgi:hypothetical protein
MTLPMALGQLAWTVDRGTIPEHWKVIHLLPHNAIPSKETSVAILQQLDTVANAIRLKNRAASQAHTITSIICRNRKAARQLSIPAPLAPHHTTNQDCPGGRISVPLPLSPTVAWKRILPTYSKPLLASHARTSMHGSQGSQDSPPMHLDSQPADRILQTPAPLVGFTEQGPNGKTFATPPIRILRIAKAVFVPFGIGASSAKGGEPGDLGILMPDA